MRRASAICVLSNIHAIPDPADLSLLPLLNLQSLLDPINVGRVTFGFMGPPITQSLGKTAILANTTHAAVFHMGSKRSVTKTVGGSKKLETFSLVGPNVASKAYLFSVVSSELENSNWTSWADLRQTDREFWAQKLERTGKSVPHLCSVFGEADTSCCLSTFHRATPERCALRHKPQINRNQND
jgi:hypothetical protein